MSEGPPRDSGEKEPSDIDWGSPRWRDGEHGQQRDVERGHRFRDDASPSQRGALDRRDSVPARSDDAEPEAPGGEDAEGRGPGEERPGR